MRHCGPNVCLPMTLKFYPTIREIIAYMWYRNSLLCVWSVKTEILLQTMKLYSGVLHSYYGDYYGLFLVIPYNRQNMPPVQIRSSYCTAQIVPMEILKFFFLVCMFLAHVPLTNTNQCVMWSLIFRCWLLESCKTEWENKSTAPTYWTTFPRLRWA